MIGFNLIWKSKPTSSLYCLNAATFSSTDSLPKGTSFSFRITCQRKKKKTKQKKRRQALLRNCCGALISSACSWCNRHLENCNQKQYFTNELRSFVKYCHSKIKFISSRHRVISTIYITTWSLCLKRRAMCLKVPNISLVHGVQFRAQQIVVNVL